MCPGKQSNICFDVFFPEKPTAPAAQILLLNNCNQKMQKKSEVYAKENPLQRNGRLCIPFSLDKENTLRLRVTFHRNTELVS